MQCGAQTQGPEIKSRVLLQWSQTGAPRQSFTIKKDNSSVSKHLSSSNGTQKINLKILKSIKRN